MVFFPPGAIGSWSLLPNSSFVSTWTTKPVCRLDRHPNDKDGQQDILARFAPLLERHCEQSPKEEIVPRHGDAIVKELKTHEGRIALRALTNATTGSLRLVLGLRFGKYVDENSFYLRLKGQKIDSSTQSVTTPEGKHRTRYIVFGHGIGPGLYSPFISRFNIADHIPGRHWLNSSTVVHDFLQAVNFTTNSTFRYFGRGQVEKSLGECLWLGVFDAEETSTSKRVSDAEGTVAGRISGALISTCNISIRFNASLDNYLEQADESVNFSIWMIIAAPFGWLAYMNHHNMISNSRSKTLRYSLLSLIAVLCFDFTVCCAMISYALAFPRSNRALVAAALVWFVQFSVFSTRSYMKTVSAYKVHPEAYTNFTKFILNRPFVSVYLMCLATVIVFSELGSYITHNIIGLGIAFSFFVPQIVHGVLEGDRNPTNHKFFIFTAINKAIPLLYYEFSSGSNFPLYKSDPALGVVVALYLVAQVVVVALQSTKGSRAIIPPFLRPKKYSYASLEDKHRTALAEDPECPICKMPMSEGQKTDAGEEDPIWVTPCQHLFHSQCLLEWIEERPECPMCRSRLPKP